MSCAVLSQCSVTASGLSHGVTRIDAHIRLPNGAHCRGLGSQVGHDQEERHIG
jgi:hypothetical protein